jgi:diguanylate cyclase (GGDEF)-like protein/PAS domain S-box-containing protein
MNESGHILEMNNEILVSDFNNVRQLRLALDNVAAYVYMKNLDSCYVYANKITLKLFGCTESTLLGSSDRDFFPPDAVQRLRQIDLRVFRGQHTQEEIVSTDANGEQRVYWEVKAPIYSDEKNTNIIGLLGISTDITEHKKLEEKLHHEAVTDSLTGLVNRRLLLELLQQALFRSQRLNSYAAILFMDLDGFKKLNDSYGHDLGDHHLIEVARRLGLLVRKVDTVARFGGDEFVILLENLGAKEEQAYQQVEKIVEKIHASLRKDYSQGNVQYRSACSIGVSLFLGDERSCDQILEKADEQMYEEKKKKGL